MASLPDTIQVDNIATQSPSHATPLIGDENVGQHATKKSILDEKPNTKVMVSEVLENRPGSRAWGCKRYISSVFNAKTILKCGAVLVKFGKFTGPGTIISVAYVDPDNFQTDVTSGVQLHYKLLFMSLSVKLGSVTGMDLAQMNRAYLPPWLNIGLYIMAEAAIVCIDIGQVIGTAIAINILIPRIPLVGGCILSAADTLIILLFYKPDGTLRALHAFELFVATFVLGIFISFCIELSYISPPAGDVLKGFLPSRDIFVSKGLFQSCAILGGTLMPHTLYLGSGLVRARMRDFDRQNRSYHETRASESKFSMMLYRPSISAIRSCMAYSIAELCIALFVIALFVNSAILIVAASSLSEEAGDADLFGIYSIFVSSISQASGTIFALGLLFSGLSAGIVATMAGQLVCEGAMNWRMSPFFRRLLTRSIAIIPGVIIASVEGRPGLATALNRCDVVRSVTLVFLTFPLVWYTSTDKYMRVRIDNDSGEADDAAPSRDTITGQDPGRTISLANNWATATGAWTTWFLIASINIVTLVFLGLRIGGD